MKKKVVIIGAGPAGLTAAYELLKQSKDFEITILEKSDCIGGISKTVRYKDNYMDMGGHRFFSRVPKVNEWWKEILGDDFLERDRLSRIYFNKRFFDYPISLKPSTFKNLGLINTVKIGGSYLKSAAKKRKEKSLEDFYINRFGKKLYSLFFENYTENLWGRHPRDISPDWGAQRVKGLSITAIIKDIFGRAFKKNRKVETSLIDHFYYPKYGPGQLWEKVAKIVVEKNGTIIKSANVTSIKIGKNNSVESVTYTDKTGSKKTKKADFVISSMPIKDLVNSFSEAPKNIKNISNNLPYRDYITIGILLKNIKLSLPDNWIYIHDKNVKVGRIQIYNNWSPHLVKNPKKNTWLGLEYFCNEGDELWNINEKAFANFASDELKTIGIIDDKKDVIDYHVEHIEKAYPAYFDSYKDIKKVQKHLDKIPNLYCIGRNGQHHYNNMDHSMCTAFIAVENILNGNKTKSKIWDVNTEKEYHEN